MPHQLGSKSLARSAAASPSTASSAVSRMALYNSTCEGSRPKLSRALLTSHPMIRPLIAATSTRVAPTPMLHSRRYTVRQPRCCRRSIASAATTISPAHTRSTLIPKVLTRKDPRRAVGSPLSRVLILLILQASRDICRPRRFAARVSGLAFGLALAVRPAGLAEVSRVNGAPGASRVVGCEAPLRLEGPAQTMRGVPARCL